MSGRTFQTRRSPRYPGWHLCTYRGFDIVHLHAATLIYYIIRLLACQYPICQISPYMLQFSLAEQLHINPCKIASRCQIHVPWLDAPQLQSPKPNFYPYITVSHCLRYIYAFTFLSDSNGAPAHIRNKNPFSSDAPCSWFSSDTSLCGNVPRQTRQYVVQKFILHQRQPARGRCWPRFRAVTGG